MLRQNSLQQKVPTFQTSSNLNSQNLSRVDDRGYMSKSKSFAGFTSSHGNLNSMSNAPIAESTEPVAVAYRRENFANKHGSQSASIDSINLNH